jgi:ABC-type nickel/cobalt efflux system permease component RcnA
MEIKKVNCEACGAPITVPEDVEFLNCSSCGSALAVQRGEGYVSLKMVKEVTSAIRDGTYATKSELQKLQITQEISMLEMQLNSIQGEIRSLDRDLVGGKSNLGHLTQRMDLNYQAFTLIDRIRRLRINLYNLSLPDYTTDQEALLSLLVLAQNAIAALKNANLNRPEVKSQLAAIQAVEKDYSQKLARVKVSHLKAGLRSFSLPKDQNLDEETAKICYNTVKADLEKIQAIPNSPEKQSVISELRQMQSHFYEEWRRAADTRIQSGLHSLDLGGPEGLDAISAQANLSLIQSDTGYLQSLEKNHIIEDYLQRLNRKERQYAAYLRKLEKKSQPGGKGCLAALGLGALAATIAGVFSKDSKTAGPASATMSADGTEETAVKAHEANIVNTADSTRRTILLGLFFGLLIFLVFCIASFMIMMPSLDSTQEEANPISAGIWLLGTSLGIAAGAGFITWRLRHEKINRKLKAWGMFAVLLVDIFLLFFSISLLVTNVSENAMGALFTAGICLAPSAALVALVVLLRRQPADAE